MTQYDTCHDYSDRGAMEAELHRHKEELKMARDDGDILAEYKLTQMIHEAEQEIEHTERKPRRLAIDEA